MNEKILAEMCDVIASNTSSMHICNSCSRNVIRLLREYFHSNNFTDGTPVEIYEDIGQ